MNHPHPATDREGSAPLLRLGSTGPQARHASRILRRVQGQLNKRQRWRRASQSSAIRGFTFKLARYLSEAVPDVDGKHPLLVGCTYKGLEGWWRSERSAHPARLPLLGYVRGALFLFPQALEWEVRWSDASGRLAVWEPLEHPISGWWKGAPALEARRRDRAQDTANVGLSPADCRLIALTGFLWCRPLRLRSLGSGLDDLVCRFG